MNRLFFLRYALLLLLLVAGAALSYAQTLGQLDSILKVLDKTIQEKPVYDRQKRISIQDLQQQLLHTEEISEKRRLMHELFSIYRSFRLDSALYYARLGSSLIDPSDEVSKVRNDLDIAEALKGLGYYSQARNRLDINRGKVRAEDMVYYYHLYYSIYHSMHQNSQLEEDRQRFRDSLLFYRKQLQSVLPPDDIGHHIGEAYLLLFENKPQEALQLMKERLARENGDLSESLLAVTFAEIYEALGMNREAEYYYAVSAVGDLQRATKKYTALQQLAILLFRDGDVDRAYHYLACALEDVTFSRIHCRITQIAQFLPIITSAYERKSETASQRKLWLVIALGLLLFIAVLGVWILHRRSMQLRRLNGKLHGLYQEIADANRQLLNTNAQVEAANSQLADANRIKEEYIGQVFNLCSAYMDKQEFLRRSIYNKVKGNQLSEVMKLVGDKSQQQEDLRDFFRNFDAIFLSLFPDFIKEFNALLRPDEHVSVKEGELLSPELRIYALVRLGINDSTRIASFLHFSPQTVYNYRLKMRARTDLPREEFVAAVQSLK
ncbi:MAG: hypothetical protein IKX25_07440 [Bacteroidales bacterium]|nr:hypothetical protein [Bacteroidales bacterium]